VPNYFTITGLAPTSDPLWRTAPVATRATYLRACRELVLSEWDRQTAEGLDRDGQPLARLKQSTIRHRRSAMGPADPHAPPLIPAHELSRTRSLVDGRVVGTAIRVYWRFDPVTGKRWGTILNYHRQGAGRLPARDVFGLAPEGYDRVLRQAHLWWAGYSRGLPTAMPIRPRPGKAARPGAARLPGYTPRALPPRPIAARTAEVAIGGDIYTLSQGSAAELLAAIKGGRFTGFRSYAGARAGAAPAPPAAAAPAIAPKPPKPKPAPPPPPLPRFGPTEATIVTGPSQAATLAAAHDLLGREVTLRDLASLSGATRGAKVIIEVSETGSLVLNTVHPDYATVRRVSRDAEGQLYLYADSFFMTGGRTGQGTGKEVFGRMVEQAAALDLDYIKVLAYRSSSANGYYTWPRFGYDGDLPADIIADLPAALASARRLSDLMASPEGREWWKVNGRSITLKFQLAAGGPDRARWEAYLREKMATATATATAPGPSPAL
jgi:hypothetical protein